METSYIQSGAARMGNLDASADILSTEREISREVEAELVGATLDIFYGCNPDIWTKGGSVQGNMSPIENPTGEFGNYYKEGTVLSFIPVLSQDEVDMEKNAQKTGVFIFSKKGDQGQIAATYSVTCYFDEKKGHERVRGSARFIDNNIPGQKKDNLLKGIALAGATAARDILFTERK